MQNIGTDDNGKPVTLGDLINPTPCGQRELAGYVLDLRTNGGRLFILRLVKEVHRKLETGKKIPTLAALERCIDLEDQLTKMNRT